MTATNVPITTDQFRAMFPLFTDTGTYSEQTVSLWLNLATNVLNVVRWGDWYGAGLGLFVAHQLSLEALMARSGIPGILGSGPIASKAINGVSVSFDFSFFASSTIEGAGDWNMTVYGRRFFTLARMVGSGPTQIVGSDAITSPLLSFGGPFIFNSVLGAWQPG